MPWTLGIPFPHVKVPKAICTLISIRDFHLPGIMDDDQQTYESTVLLQNKSPTNHLRNGIWQEDISTISTKGTSWTQAQIHIQRYLPLSSPKLSLVNMTVLHNS